MRIGLDVRALQTRDGSGGRGIGRYVSDLLESLLQYGPEDRVVLFTLPERPLPAGWAERCEVVPVQGLVFQEMTKPWYMRLPKIRSNQTLLGRLHARAVASQRAGMEAAVASARLDVLHLPTSVDVGSYPEGSFGVPVVMTFLDAIPLIDRAELYDKWAGFLQRHYDRQLENLRTAAAVVAISDASREDAIRFGKLSPERVRTIYPSIAPVFGEPVDAAPVLAKYGIEGPYVLFCSVPDPHKNPIRVIQAFAAAKGRLEVGMKLVFVSPNSPPYEPRIREAARAAGLSEAEVLITGRVSDEELVALFQASRCLASPSIIEGFGLPAAQALAAGTPAIVSNRGSQPEVVGDAGIVVDPEDVSAIAEAMVTATSPERRAELVLRGKERAGLFTLERQGTALLALYRSLTAM